MQRQHQAHLPQMQQLQLPIGPIRAPPYRLPPTYEVATAQIKKSGHGARRRDPPTSGDGQRLVRGKQSPASRQRPVDPPPLPTAAFSATPQQLHQPPTRQAPRFYEETNGVPRRGVNSVRPPLNTLPIIYEASGGVPRTFAAPIAKRPPPPYAAPPPYKAAGAVKKALPAPSSPPPPPPPPRTPAPPPPLPPRGEPDGCGPPPPYVWKPAYGLLPRCVIPTRPQRGPTASQRRVKMQKWRDEELHYDTGSIEYWASVNTI